VGQNTEQELGSGGNRSVMNHVDRADYINSLDDELLKGGVLLSEWSTFMIRDADTAFCNGADLAAILACQAAIESHLRYEYFVDSANRKLGFFDLIEQAPLPADLKCDLHVLRRYRNLWVHVNEPDNDEDLLKCPEFHLAEIDQMAVLAIKVLRQVIYEEQWV